MKRLFGILGAVLLFSVEAVIVLTGIIIGVDYAARLREKDSVSEE